MPPARRSNLSRRTRNNARKHANSGSQTVDQQTQQNALQQVRNERRSRSSNSNPNPSPSYPASRRTSRVPRRAVTDMEFAAFNYNSDIDYSEHGSIGAMTVICPHCDAVKFSGETAGMCCANGKVRLPAFQSPPDPLHSLVSGTSPMSKHFLSRISEYNSAFQMTSFGATKIVRDNFMPTFKVITSCGISYGNCDLHNKYFHVFKNFDTSSYYIKHIIYYTDSRPDLPSSWVFTAIS